jgi:hypothetical protein
VRQRNGTVLSDYVTTIGDTARRRLAPSPAAAGENKTCTITNVKKGMVKVIKRSSGQLASGFHFEIRINTTTTDAGSLIGAGITDGERLKSTSPPSSSRVRRINSARPA